MKRKPQRKNNYVENAKNDTKLHSSHIHRRMSLHIRRRRQKNTVCHILKLKVHNKVLHSSSQTRRRNPHGTNQQNKESERSKTKPVCSSRTPRRFLNHPQHLYLISHKQFFLKTIIIPGFVKSSVDNSGGRDSDTIRLLQAMHLNQTEDRDRKSTRLN